MEGSFDNDVLIGDGGNNSILGQPGEDRIYGNGGDDVLDARDGVRDVVVQCAPGTTSAAPSTSRASAPGDRRQRPRLHRPLRPAARSAAAR